MLNAIVQRLTQGGEAAGYFLREDLLYCGGLVCSPETLKTAAIRLCLEEDQAGHPGIWKTEKRVTEGFNIGKQPLAQVSAERFNIGKQPLAQVSNRSLGEALHYRPQQGVSTLPLTDLFELQTGHRQSRQRVCVALVFALPVDDLKIVVLEGLDPPN